MSDVEALKKEAGIAACAFVKNGMKVGLGTGSTVKHTVVELGRRMAEEGLEIVGVPTSLATEKLAIKVGIPLVQLSSIDGLDIVIDGADEYDPHFQLIKGGGAALLREKVVAQESAAMVVVADDRKRVEHLGAFPLPIEVTPFEHQATIRALGRLLDCRVNCRMAGDNAVVTDNGNMIADAIWDQPSRNLWLLRLQSSTSQASFKLVCSMECVTPLSWQAPMVLKPSSIRMAV